MHNRLKIHIENTLSFLSSSKLLIAISGGIDSVVLTHLCKQLQLNFALAHCNFNLRNDDSNADEAFVLQLAANLDREVFIESFDTNIYAENNKLSIQMAARKLRYNWFYELAERLQFDYILTAHHADDNLETFLINLSRGTGLEGLTGIPEINDKIVRPLLVFTRADIENYAKTNNLKWRDDKSNASTKYLRNKIRHDVIPQLKEVNPQLLQNFNKTQKYLKNSKAIVEDRIEAVLKQVISTTDKQYISFEITKIKALSNPKAYLFEFLKDYNFAEWNDVYNLMEAQSGKQVFSKTHRLIKDRKYLLLSKHTLDNNKDITVFENDLQIKTPLGTLFFEEEDLVSTKNSNVIYVDKALLQFPLLLRQWQEGDYFYPLGMHGKKKLSKFFKDEKISLLEKENTWLLCSRDAIVWILGKRADQRFKITDNTKQVLKITLKNS